MLLGFWLGIAGRARLRARRGRARRSSTDGCTRPTRASLGTWRTRCGFCPALLVWAAGLAIVFWQPDDVLLARGLPLVGALLVGLAVFAQDREIARAADSSEPGHCRSQLLSLLTYLAALGLFTLIYQIKERSVIRRTLDGARGRAAQRGPRCGARATRDSGRSSMPS